jgi:hypothetical protein
MTSFADDVLRTLGRVTELLDDLGVSWAVGGSLSSSLYGTSRPE